MMDEPDDDYMTAEQASDAGWIDPDTAEDLCALMKHVEFAPTPGSKSNAALVIIDSILCPRKPGAPEDPSVTWAKQLLGRT